MFKKLLFSMVLCAIAISSFAQNVNIPDANFKAYLVGNTAINTNSDSEIQVSEASAYTGTIYLLNSNISDLTGIEAFTQITQLQCRNNQLTTLDVSNNTQLTFLDCGDNQLTSIDTSLLTNLLDFRISINNITSVDLSNNTLLERFNAQLVSLTQLDLSNNIALNHVEIAANSLTELDLTNNNLLELVLIGGSNITSLDIRNGNNTIITDFELISNNSVINPVNLDCIFVDDANYSNANWTNPYPTETFFVETEAECAALSVTDFQISNISIYPNPFNSQLFIDVLQQATKTTIYDIYGKLVVSTSNTSIDTSKLSSGLYIIKVETKKGSISKKMIKQ